MPQRYFVNEINGQILGQDAHHITRVMRMETGEDIVVCAKGVCVIATLHTLGDPVLYDIKSTLVSKKEKEITIIQGLPKHPKQEFVAKYATIFGATELIFVPMQRSISKLENTDHKTSRLHSIAKEAAELAHRTLIPSIQMAKSLESINFDSYDLILLADELEHTQDIPSVIKKTSIDSKIAIIIGPEGGISETERKSLKNRKAIPVTLGSNILPTEAACLYALTLLSNQNA
jgi:16S rRNA (uracil1498-N3)-methyltransferase